MITITLLGLISFISLVRRFRKNPAGSIINPLFHLLLFSLLYLLLPLYYIDFSLIIQNDINISQTAISSAYNLSLWYVACFYLFFCLSNDIKCEFNMKESLNIKIYRIAKCLYFAINIILVLLIIRYVPSIYALKENRSAALLLYETILNGTFKLRIIMYIHLITIFLIFWKSHKLRYLLPCSLYLIIDYSHGGRTVSLMILVFSYFIVLIKKKNTYFKYVISVVILMVVLGLLQRSTSNDLYWNLYMAGAEFSNTYLTTLYLLTNTNYSLNGLEYCIVSISKLVPGGIIDKLLDFGEWYGNDLSDKIGLGYGLAGNIITEALVYGGKLFSILQPIFIGLILLYINKATWRKTLGGILYTLLICIAIQNIMRSYFWGYLLYPIQFLVFWAFWLKSEYHKKIF